MRPVAATGSTRYTRRAMRVGGHFLPKGTMVDVPFYAVRSPPSPPPPRTPAAALSHSSHTAPECVCDVSGMAWLWGCAHPCPCAP